MRIHNLRTANKAAVKPFAVQAAAEETTVWLYDFIGFDPWTQTGVGAEQFAKEIAAIKTPVIRLRINSPGGSVFDGRAMAAALKAHKSKVVASIEGVAASAATFVAVAADEVQMAKGSMFMIHNAWTIAMGNANDLMETAALLEKLDGTLVDDYTAKTGKSAQQVKDWMAAETWFTADEAVTAGFADAVVDGDQVDATYDLSAYGERAPKMSAHLEATATVDVPVADVQQASKEVAEEVSAQIENDLASAWDDACRRLALVEKTSA